MPSSKAILDLEAWSNFLPQERNNDYEYNLLLYKFKSFYNEVKKFQDLHSNCSVTRAAPNSNTDPPVFGLPSNNNAASQSPLASDNKYVVSCPSTVKGQQVISKTKNSYFQHQNSVPLKGGSQTIDNFARQNCNHHLVLSQTQDTSTTVQHYNSSYNLPTFISGNGGLNKPEIKRRNPVLNPHLQLSKSSERLDTLNNNNPQIASSLKKPEPSLPQIKSNNTPISSDNKYMQNDDNIYDAVSPDDTAGASNVAASINNLNRLSLPQKNKLESSKSSLGLGSSVVETGKVASIASKFALGATKPISNSSNDTEKRNNSFSSPLIPGNANNSSSSLSILASLTPKENDPSSRDYANYVNIDFFLKRSHSPSFDGLEEDPPNHSSDDSDEDTTQMSQSLSSDVNGDESGRNISSHSLVAKLSTKGNINSSDSLTPASSGDFLDEQRSSSMNHVIQSPNNRLASLFSMSSRENESSFANKHSTSPRESSNKNSPQTLGAIRENSLTTNHTASLDLEKDDSALLEANNTMRSFLSDLNLSPIDDVFEDKAQRRIVKESFAVEFCGRRKLRHLFLFNDVIVCAKYQASSKQKFTFDVKWYLNLNGVSISDLSDQNNQVKYDKDSIESQILAIRTQLMMIRGQMQHIKRSKHKQPSKIIKKLKKKRTELEAELVLLLPHLPLVIKHLNGKKFTFFLSSNFDRNQWIESIKFLQSQLPTTTKGSSTSPSSSELQAWIQTCRKNLNPSLGTFLLRSNCDDDLLYGDLYINLNGIFGISKPGPHYFCFEVDSYGHFSQKASSSVLHVENSEHTLNEEYIFPLDGAHTLRILLYEDLGPNLKPSVVGKAHVELSRAWFLDKPVEKVITFNSNLSLSIQLSYSSSELLLMRIPHAKLCPTFGMDITQVCKKEKTNVPLLIQLCVNEVERRGMREVGIYRMSGTSTDIQRLKRAFESNPFEAEMSLRDIDINSVTGFLKTYLREMPEGLFSNKLYLKFVSAFNIPQSENLERTRTMLELFRKIPIVNQHTIIHIVEHLVKVNKYENINKMSLTNLATVLGPNILRPPTESSSSNSSDPFTAVVIGSMSQAGILYFFLNRKFSNLSLTELDPSELAGSSRLERPNQCD